MPATDEAGLFRIGRIAFASFRFLYWRIGVETLVWIGALVYLALHNPYAETSFTICPLENIGFHYCPGCGLGRAVSFLIHGDLVRSVQTHILGIPATIILVIRTFSLLIKALRKKLPQPSFH